MRTDTVSSLRQRMIEDMNARKLGSHTQRSRILSCKRFAAFLKRSPDTATAEDIRRFQLHLSQTSMSICSRNRIMTGLRFLFRVTLRRLDLAAEIYPIREPQKIPLVMSPDETRRLLAVFDNLKVRTLLGLGYGCGLRAGEVVRLRVKHIDRAQKIIRPAWRMSSSLRRGERLQKWATDKSRVRLCYNNPSHGRSALVSLRSPKSAAAKSACRRASPMWSGRA